MRQLDRGAAWIGEAASHRRPSNWALGRVVLCGALLSFCLSCHRWPFSRTAETALQLSDLLRVYDASAIDARHPEPTLFSFCCAEPQCCGEGTKGGDGD